MLKPQDVVLAVKLLCKGKQDWSQGSLAQELCMSASEINAGLKRLDQCGLIEPHKDGRRWQVIKANFKEFLLSGIAYVFPAQKGAPCTGVVTATSHDKLLPHFQQKQHGLPVWPDRHAKVRGFAFEPLYPSVTKAVQQDELLHEWLAIIDCLRDRDNPEVDVARVLLREKLNARSKTAAKAKKQDSSLMPENTDHQLDLLG